MERERKKKSGSAGRRLARSLAIVAVVPLCVAERILRRLLSPLMPPMPGSVDRQWKAQERRRIESHAPDPTASLVLALPERTVPEPNAQANENDGENARPRSAPVPSKVRLLRHLRKRWLGKMMAFGFSLVALCLAVLLIAPLFRVGAVTVTGAEHYAERELLSIAAIKPDSELFALDPAAIEARLLRDCPYLKTVQVERMLTGVVRISAEERRAVLAIPLQDGRVALLDDTLWVLEICPAAPADTLTVDAGDIPQAEPGEVLALPDGTRNDILTVLAAVRESGIVADGAVLSMRDRYALVLTFADGTTVRLHECRRLTEKLRAADRALAEYQRPEGGDALVADAGDPGRVTVSYHKNP